MAGSVAPDTGPSAGYFAANPGLGRARRWLATFRWVLALGGAAIVDVIGLGGFRDLFDPRIFAVNAICVTVTLLLLGLVLPRLPRRYELTVDDGGLCLTADQEINRILWHDVQYVSTRRSSAGRLRPNAW